MGSFILVILCPDRLSPKDLLTCLTSIKLPSTPSTMPWPGHARRPGNMSACWDYRLLLILVPILVLLNVPGSQQPSHRHDVPARDWSALQVLNGSRYGDFDASDAKWLELVGFKEQDGFAWHLLAPAQEHVRRHIDRVFGNEADAAVNGSLGAIQDVVMYRNISGYVHGQWLRSELPLSLDNASSLSTAEHHQNSGYSSIFAGQTGDVRLHFTQPEERARLGTTPTASEISARMILADDTPAAESWEVDLNGMLFPQLGLAMLTTHSKR